MVKINTEFSVHGAIDLHSAVIGCYPFTLYVTFKKILSHSPGAIHYVLYMRRIYTREGDDRIVLFVTDLIY